MASDTIYFRNWKEFAQWSVGQDTEVWGRFVKLNEREIANQERELKLWNEVKKLRNDLNLAMSVIDKLIRLKADKDEPWLS